MKRLICICTVLIATSLFAKTNSEEKELMVKLGQGNASEVDLARIVEPKATNPDVKAFARQMIADHGKAFEQLEGMAREENVTLKSGMDAEHVKFASTLAARKIGATYDRTYVDEMVKDHESDKKDAEEALRKIKDPDLKRWTEAQLVTIEHHLKMAEDLRDKLK
jgi:putative membrane protein